jgi:hypothetical protein
MNSRACLSNGGGVVEALRHFRDVGFVTHEAFGFIVTSAPAQAAKVFIEAPVSRPTSIRFGLIHPHKISVHGDMPLAGHVGPVAILFKNFGDGGHGIGELAAVAGTVFIDGGHPTHFDRVLVPACQQGGPAGAAATGIGEVGEADSSFGQFIEVGSADFSAVGTEIRKAEVIAHDEDHVRPFRFFLRRGIGSAGNHEEWRYQQKGNEEVGTYFHNEVPEWRVGSQPSSIVRFRIRQEAGCCGMPRIRKAI